MTDLKNKICLDPFLSAQIHVHDYSVGTYFLHPCCPNWCNYYSLNDGVIENFSMNGLMDIFNSSKAKEFRQSILDGSYKFCNKELCPYILGNRLVNKNDLVNINPGYKQIIENNEAEIELRYIHLCYDYSCNFKCPSCRKNVIMLTENNNPVLFNQYLKMQNEIIKYAHSKEFDFQIGLSGTGDPIASILGRKLLYELDKNKNPKLSLLIQTNGSLFDENFWDKMYKMHGNIGVIVSVDAGTEKTYSKLRVNGNWNKLMHNLKFINKLNLEKLIQWVRLDFVCQQQNYMEIPLFIELARKLNFSCMISRINDWKTYTKEEFNNVDVFNSSHPEHNNLIKVLNIEYNYDKLVWGNLNEFIKK